MAASPALVAVLVFVSVVQVGLWLKKWAERRKMKKAHGCKPVTHYPHTVPFLGLDYFRQIAKAFRSSTLLDKWEADLARFGSTYQFSLWGRETIITQEPANVQAVLSSDFDKWGVGPFRFKVMKPMVEDSFFTIDGPFWKYARNLTKPALSRAEFSDLSRLEVYVSRLFELIKADGSTVDFASLSGRLMQDFGTEYFLGESIGSLTSQPSAENIELMEDLEYSMKATTKRIFIGDLLFLIPMDKKLRKACKTIHRFIDGHIDRISARLASGSVKAKDQGETTHINFINEIVKETNDRSFLRSSAITMYVGGTDTTNITLSNTIMNLSRYPKVLEKLRDEVMAIAPTVPTLSTLQKMPYLRAIINETLRLYPIAPQTARMALQDTILPTGGGPDGKSPVFVKKGTRMFLYFRGMHYNKEIWGEDAREFRPERFLDSKLSNSPYFMPFGAGPRTCPGQQLALTNLSYVLTRIMQEYKAIESRDDRPWTEDLKITVSNKNGCSVAFESA